MLDFIVGNDLLSALLAFAIVLIPAVIVHELGHFLAARAVGITVLEFGIGFPPRIAKLFTWRETEFTLNMIPLGGFVRPLGEDMIRPVGEEETAKDREKVTARTIGQTAEQPRSEDGYQSEREELAARGVTNMKAVHEVKPLPRIVFMAAGAIANFIFAFFVFLLVGLLGIPQEVGVRVGFAAVPENTALIAEGIEAGDYIERVNGEYFDSAGEMLDYLIAREGQTVDVQIRRAEIVPNEVFDTQITLDAGLLAELSAGQPYVLVTSIEEDSPGAQAGLIPGDYITAFNGRPLTETSDPAENLVRMTNQAAGEEVTLTVLREGDTLEINVVPRLNPPPNRGRIGINIAGQFVSSDGLIYLQGSQSILVPQTFGDSLNYATDTTSSILQQIVAFPARIIQGQTAPEERRVVSIVGISQLGGNILQSSIEEDEPTPLFNYVALISIALGFTNLLPIPALDGGRIVFAVLELIRGKPIPPEREGMVHLVGVMFILSLSIIVIINDLMNPLTNLIP